MSLVTAPVDVDVLIKKIKDALIPSVALIAPKACLTDLAAAVDKAVCFNHVYGIGYAISTNNNGLKDMCDTTAPFLITAIAENSIDVRTAISVAVAMAAAGAAAGADVGADVGAAAGVAARVAAMAAAASAEYKSFCDLISTTLVDVVAKSNTIAAAASYCKDDR